MTQEYTSTSGSISTGPINRGFENHDQGESYDREKQEADWDYRDGASSTEAVAEISSDVARTGENSLKVTYSSDERVKTASKFELPEEDEYFSSYWVYFDEDFSFNGVEKSGGKLPGLGSDEVPTGGEDVTGENGFSARYMWRYDGQAELYLYHVDKAGSFGDSVKFQNDAGEFKFFETGKWHNIVQRVKVNEGDEYNGEIDVWLDGEQVVDIDGVRLSTNDQGVDVFYLSTFYGGGSTDWLPPEDTKAYFDDFVIGTNPEDVGLSAADIRSPDENPDQRVAGNGIVRGILPFQPETTEQELPDGSTGEIYHDKQWGDGYTATLYYTPISDASDWTIQVRTPGPIEDLWNGEIISYVDGVYTIRGTTKSELDAGETAHIRIKGEGHGSLVEFVDGQTVGTSTEPLPQPAPVASEPTPELAPELVEAPTANDPAPSAPAATPPAAIQGQTGDGTIEVANQWNSGFIANVVFAPETDVDEWTVQIRVSGEIEDIWNGEIVARDGDVYTINGVSYNTSLDAGESAGIRFKATGGTDGLEFLGVVYDGEAVAPAPQEPDVADDTNEENDTGTDDQNGASGPCAKTGAAVCECDKEAEVDGDDMEVVTPPATPSTGLLIELVDTRTDAVLAQITDGQTIPAGLIGNRNVSISVTAAESDFADQIGSVRLTYGDHVRVENVAPYALFGDVNGNFLRGIELPNGPQTLTVEVFSGANASGTRLIQQDTDFVVRPAAQAVDGDEMAGGDNEENDTATDDQNGASGPCAKTGAAVCECDKEAEVDGDEMAGPDMGDADMGNAGQDFAPLIPGGTVYSARNPGVVTDFDPATDMLDLGPLTIHTQTVVDTAEGLLVMHMYDFDQSLLLEGVYLKDLQAANFAPISDAHLQQDLSASLAWENGTGLVRENTVYVRSHESGLAETVDFNPQTDTVSFFYLSVRGDGQYNFSVEQTAEGVRFYSPLTDQSVTLRGTTFADLDSSNFEWRANQIEDDIADRIGLSDVIAGFEYDSANVYSGKSVPMAGLVDRAPYHNQQEYTGTPIDGRGGPGATADQGGGATTPVAPTPEPSTPSTELLIELIDTRTNNVIAQIGDGQTLPMRLTDDRNVTVVVRAVDPDFADQIGSVRLSLGGHVQVESVAPYALFGDEGGEFIDGIDLADGLQMLTVEVFSGANASGRMLTEREAAFEVQEAPAAAVPDTAGRTPVTPTVQPVPVVETPDERDVSDATDAPDGVAVANSPFTTGDYAQVLNMSMQFYYAQYAGDLPDDFPITWRGDSVLDDGASVGRDLSGGWFDAGDHVKFGLPMAATATMLAWGGIEFEDGYRETGAYNDLDTHLRHVTDYFLQAYDDKGTASVADDVFHAQVGDGNIDHSYWGSPEDMDLERPVYSIDAENPGTEVAAETAAALASASIFFRNQGDTAYADTLVEKAAKLFEFAETYQGTYNDSVEDATQFYRSFDGTYEDELSWSAAWLYKATGEQSYLDMAEEYWDYPWTQGAQSWDNKSNGVTLLLAQETGDQKYVDLVESHIDFWINDIDRTASTDTNDGLGWLMQWGSNRMAANASLVATVWAKDLAEEGNSDARVAEILDFVTDQLDFMLGDNPDGQSFVVGFGDDFPLNPHHRAASGTFLDDPEPNEHILYGALVGGPSDPSGTYNDVRSDFITNEVATDYNAGFSGVLAGAFQAYDEGWII